VASRRRWAVLSGAAVLEELAGVADGIHPDVGIRVLADHTPVAARAVDVECAGVDERVSRHDLAVRSEDRVDSCEAVPRGEVSAVGDARAVEPHRLECAGLGEGSLRADRPARHRGYLEVLHAVADGRHRHRDRGARHHIREGVHLVVECEGLAGIARQGRRRRRERKQAGEHCKCRQDSPKLSCH